MTDDHRPVPAGAQLAGRLHTHSEWQEAVDAAAGVLALHNAVLAGTINGDATALNVARCIALLEQAELHGVAPDRGRARSFAAELAVGLGYAPRDDIPG